MNEKETWGYHLLLNMHNCNPDKIRDADFIKRFVSNLCKLIDMKRFGDTVVVHFGEDEKVAGFSMTQLIETSLISAHFANKTNTVYFDIFSCREYNEDTTIKFCMDAFESTDCTHHFIPRY